MLELEVPNLKLLWRKVVGGLRMCLLFGLLYKPPKDPNVFILLRKLLEKNESDYEEAF